MGKRILSYDLVRQISQQYSSRFEFQKGDKAAYNKAVKEGWINSYTWLGVPIRKINNSLDKVHLIYAYLDNDNKVVYIGRTNNIRQRHSQHNRISYKYKTYDVVKRYFISIGIIDKLPIPIILEDNLNLVESQAKEEYYIKKYKDNGWNILNTAKTGVNVSSTGSFVKKWTYRDCEKLALSCKTRREFQSKSSRAYSVSKKNGWIDKWLPISTNYHKAEYSWTKELCIDIAKKYTSITEFSRQESQAYHAAKRHGWIKDFDWLKRAQRTPITEEEIIQIAQKFKYASDFKKNYPSHYHRARKIGILKDLEFIPKERIMWTYETCRVEAMKFSSQIAFRKASPVAYNVSLKKKWINQWLPKTNTIRTDQELLEEAKSYTNINDLRKNNNSLYCLIQKRGLLQHTKLKYIRKKWTDEKVKEVAVCYNTRYDFQKGCKGAYNYALKHKMLDILFPNK